jgi:hypothetical protein
MLYLKRHSKSHIVCLAGLTYGFLLLAGTETPFLDNSAHFFQIFGQIPINIES